MDAATAAREQFHWLTARELYASAAGPIFCSNAINNDDDDSSLRQRTANANAIQSEEYLPADPNPKDLLFEKPLTPSDVGKLNRLVIPKQHAEKCFPLDLVESSDGGGLLLGFEDEVGKSWRFRYSYWNSSQSYVLTKGWSRFVKEKRLDAGDVVVFSRHSVEIGRLFIGWKRKNSIGGLDQANLARPPRAADAGQNRNSPQSPGKLPQSIPSHHQPQYNSHAGINIMAGSSSASSSPTSMVQKQTGNSKKLRLFGVNLECEGSQQSATPVGSSSSYLPPYFTNTITHMGATYSGGNGTYQQLG